MGCELGEGLDPQPLLYLEPPGEGALFLSVRCPFHAPNPTMHTFMSIPFPLATQAAKQTGSFRDGQKTSILCCRFFCS